MSWTAQHSTAQHSTAQHSTAQADAENTLMRHHHATQPHLQVRLNQPGAQRSGVAALAAGVGAAHLLQWLQQGRQAGALAGGGLLRWGSRSTGSNSADECGPGEMGLGQRCRGIPQGKQRGEQSGMYAAAEPTSRQRSMMASSLGAQKAGAGALPCRPSPAAWSISKADSRKGGRADSGVVGSCSARYVRRDMLPQP